MEVAVYESVRVVGAVDLCGLGRLWGLEMKPTRGPAWLNSGLGTSDINLTMRAVRLGEERSRNVEKNKGRVHRPSRPTHHGTIGWEQREVGVHTQTVIGRL